LAVLLFLLILKYLPSSGLWHKLILKDAENTKDGFVSGQDYNRYLGQKGVVISILRPAGTIEIEEVHLDVISEGQYVEAGRWVKVVNINGTRIVVQPVKE
jgi:membrane-bound serine protease (ClpP class)